ncbi:hypothetical protein [uncultured Arthrobacter sp.]|uniref:hypothetical protein n=1 Tax=uncultured Arthrobacter sp. TaxID=114050 RepID=UPI002623CEDA|nr:hypothetical protein [uncultured Arthrobacter sp.]
MSTLLQTSAAQASEQEPALQFSTDGVSYSTTLSDPVLQNLEPIVPGGAIERRLWIRNNGGDDALLSIAALAGTVAPALEQELKVRTATQHWSGAQAPLGKSGSCSNLAVGLPVSAGETMRLALDLQFDIDAPNETRQQSAGFALSFLLQDARVGTTSGACSDPRGVVVPGFGSNNPAAGTPVQEPRAQAPHGILAYTGASMLPWLTGGAVAIGVGALLVALVRRRSSEQRKEQQ